MFRRIRCKKSFLPCNPCFPPFIDTSRWKNLKIYGEEYLAHPKLKVICWKVTHTIFFVQREHANGNKVRLQRWQKSSKSSCERQLSRCCCPIEEQIFSHACSLCVLHFSAFSSATKFQYSWRKLYEVLNLYFFTHIFFIYLYVNFTLAVWYISSLECCQFQSFAFSIFILQRKYLNYSSFWFILRICMNWIKYSKEAR